MNFGEIIALEVGPGGSGALEGVWGDGHVDVGRSGVVDPLVRGGGSRQSRRTLVFDVRRESVRQVMAADGVEDEPSAVFAPHAVPLPVWAGAEALTGFSGFRSGCREGGCLGSDWWEGVEDRLRSELEACDRVQGFLCCVDGSDGYSGVAYSLLREAEDQCGSRPRVVLPGWRDVEDAGPDAEGAILRRAALGVDAAVSFRELHDASDALAGVLLLQRDFNSFVRQRSPRVADDPSGRRRSTSRGERT